MAEGTQARPPQPAWATPRGGSAPPYPQPPQYPWWIHSIPNPPLTQHTVSTTIPYRTNELIPATSHGHHHDPLPDNQTQDRQRRRHRRLPRRRHARPIRRLPNLPPATGSPAPHHLRKRRRPQLHRRNHTRFIPEARQAKFQAADQVRYRARQVNPRRHRRRTLHRPLPRKRNGRRDQELQTPPPHGRRPRAPKPRLRQIRPHRGTHPSNHHQPSFRRRPEPRNPATRRRATRPNHPGARASRPHRTHRSIRTHRNTPTHPSNHHQPSFR